MQTRDAFTKRGWRRQIFSLSASTSSPDNPIRSYSSSVRPCLLLWCLLGPKFSVLSGYRPQVRVKCWILATAKERGKRKFIELRKIRPRWWISNICRKGFMLIGNKRGRKCDAQFCETEEKKAAQLKDKRSRAQSNSHSNFAQVMRRNWTCNSRRAFPGAIFYAAADWRPSNQTVHVMGQEGRNPKVALEKRPGTQICIYSCQSCSGKWSLNIVLRTSFQALRQRGRERFRDKFN